MEIITCKNCGTQFTGKFCNNCSQPSDTGKINLRYLWKELVNTFIRFDSGFVYTTKKLFQNPGKALLEYISGARIKYLRPFKYLILIAGTDILLTKFFHLSFIKGELADHGQIITDAYIKDNFALIQLALIILYSLISIGLFNFRHFNFYEFIVIHTYLAGQRILINIFFISFHVWYKTAFLDNYLNGLSLLVGNGLMIWAYVVMFSQKNAFLITLKTIIMQLIVFGGLLFLLAKLL